MAASRTVSLRRGLQSTALLAVLAGYALLLVVNQSLSSLQRRQAHHQLVSQLQASLASRSELQGVPALGLELELLPIAASQQPRLMADRQGLQWLESRSSVQLPDGAWRSLRVRQNVTDSVQREWIGQLLLIAAAGASSLVTSGLLRLVLLRGLVRPLNRLSTELASLNTSSLGQQYLEVSEQPEELRPIAEAFNALQERLAASWERERTFVDGVAHELRTPLTLILGRSQRLRRELPPASRYAVPLDQVVAEAKRMTNLVSVLLDLARQDSGRFSLQLLAFDAEQSLLELYERLLVLSPERLRLLEPDSEPSPPALGDPERVQQCLTALVDNALCYSEGAVELWVEQKSDGLVLHVRDHGPGVLDAEKRQIFQRFVRGSTAVNRRGSGIGLAVVDRLMQAMGGEVQVVDPPGGGADFQLRLPLATPAEVPA